VGSPTAKRNFEELPLRK
jgi:hypothetical protein